MYIMCQNIFEEKAEILDQHPLSLNRARLQKSNQIKSMKNLAT